MFDEPHSPSTWDLSRQIGENTAGLRALDAEVAREYVRKDVYDRDQRRSDERLDKIEGRFKWALTLWVGPVTSGVVIWYLTRGTP